MNKLKIALVVLLLPLFCLAQNNENPTIDILQGTWKYYPYVEGSADDFEGFAINKGNKRLFLTYWKGEQTLTSNIEYWGLLTSDSKNLSSLNAIGKKGNRYYCVTDKCVTNKAIICSGRNCEIRVLSNAYYELFWHEKPDTYQRIQELPDYVLAKINADSKILSQYNQFKFNEPQKEASLVTENKAEPIESKKENTNRSTENKGIINKTKVYIYAQPGKLTKMYFIKNDVIDVLEEREGWVKFKFFNKRTITGWVKKSEVDLK